MPEDPSVTSSFLEDEGRALVEFHRQSAALTTLSAEPERDQDICNSVVNALAGNVPQPADLLGLVERSPDQGLAALFVNDLAAKSDLLRTCDPSGGGFQERAEEVAATHILVARRLDAYGIGR